VAFLRGHIYGLDHGLAFDLILYPYDYRKFISTYRPQGRAKKRAFQRRGVGVSGFAGGNAGKMERSSSCFRPSDRAARNHPSDEDPAAASRVPPVDLAAHSLQSDCAPVEGNSPQETGASRRGRIRVPGGRCRVEQLWSRLGAPRSTSDDVVRYAPGAVGSDLLTPVGLPARMAFAGICPRCLQSSSRPPIAGSGLVIGLP
jgi:hypothetical protein